MESAAGAIYRRKISNDKTMTEKSAIKWWTILQIVYTIFYFSTVLFSFWCSCRQVNQWINQCSKSKYMFWKNGKKITKSKFQYNTHFNCTWLVETRYLSYHRRKYDATNICHLKHFFFNFKSSKSNKLTHRNVDFSHSTNLETSAEITQSLLHI